jgi:hypothetical protein
MTTSAQTDHPHHSAFQEEHPVSSSTNAARARFGALVLAVAGVCFILYPALRPFSDEITLAGARAFASNAWFASHLLAMIGFILLALGVLAVHDALRPSGAERPAFWALVTTWVGAGLTLPYYGAEDFALRAIGQEAVRQQSASLLVLANATRYGPGVYAFVAGLLLLAVGTILAAIAVWRSGTFTRWSGLPLALGFVLFVPQFFTNQPIRVAHGALVAAGCLWLAAGLWQWSRQRIA